MGGLLRKCGTGSSLQFSRFPNASDRQRITFPNFNTKGPLFQTNLIFPVPCEFISPDLPHCAVIRPSSDQFSGAKAAAAALTNDGLFVGQTPAFFQALNQLAEEADAAIREL